MTIAAHEEHPDVEHGESKGYGRNKLPTTRSLHQDVVSVHDKGKSDQRGDLIHCFDARMNAYSPRYLYSTELIMGGTNLGNILVSD